MTKIDLLDEQKRLEALYSYNILDSDIEKDFDELTEMAAAICETPIALISFVDKDRQWFKSRHGINTAETDRCYSFCSYAIQHPQETHAGGRCTSRSSFQRQYSGNR